MIVNRKSTHDRHLLKKKTRLEVKEASVPTFWVIQKGSSHWVNQLPAICSIAQCGLNKLHCSTYGCRETVCGRAQVRAVCHEIDSKTSQGASKRTRVPKPSGTHGRPPRALCAMRMRLRLRLRTFAILAVAAFLAMVVSFCEREQRMTAPCHTVTAH